MLLTVSRAPNHTLKLLTRDRCLTEINLTHPRFHRDMTRTPIREAVQHYLLTWVRKVWGGGSPEIQASPRHPKCSSHSISLNRGYRLKVPQVHTRSDMVTRGAPPCYSLTPRRSPPKQAGPSKPRAPSAVLSSAGPARTRKGWRPRPRSGGRCGRGQVWPGAGVAWPWRWCPAGGREAWRWGQRRERHAGPRQYTCTPGARASSGRWLGVSSVHTGAGAPLPEASRCGPRMGVPSGQEASPRGCFRGAVLWTSLLTL